MTDRLTSEGSEDGWVRRAQAGAASAQWRPGTQFRTRLFRIANNPAFDAMRHRKLVEFVPLEDFSTRPLGWTSPPLLASKCAKVEVLLKDLIDSHGEGLLLHQDAPAPWT